jgi:hypothetical protein
LGIGLTYLAAITKVGFLGLLFGTIAVFAYGFVAFAPYEIYKAKKDINPSSMTWANLEKMSERVNIIKDKTQSLFTPVIYISVIIIGDFRYHTKYSV